MEILYYIILYVNLLSNKKLHLIKFVICKSSGNRLEATVYTAEM